MEATFTIDQLMVASDTITYALTRNNGTQTVHATSTDAAESNREVFTFAVEEGSWRSAGTCSNTPN